MAAGEEEAFSVLADAIVKWQGMGLDGIEAYSSHHEAPSPDCVEGVTGRLLQLARDRGLAVSGGSDYHGGGKPERIGSGMGGLRVHAGVLAGWHLSAGNVPRI